MPDSKDLDLTPRDPDMPEDALGLGLAEPVAPPPAAAPAAGSVADRAGWVAVAALGAEGVQLGTRLVVTREGAEAFPDYVQQLILAAGDTDTMSADGPPAPGSAGRNSPNGCWATPENAPRWARLRPSSMTCPATPARS